MLGMIFMVLWASVWAVWGFMTLFGTLMMNDSGRLPGDAHLAIALAVHGGQVLAGGAGIPGGMAFFMRGKRAFLWLLFGVLTFIGIVCQVGAFFYFDRAMSPQ